MQWNPVAGVPALLLLSCALTSGSSPQQAVLLHGLLNVVAVALKQDKRSLRACALAGCRVLQDVQQSEEASKL